MDEDERAAAGNEPGGEDISSWPVLETLGTEQEAMLVVGFLRSNGLPAEMESLVFHQEPVNFGSLGEARVRVPEEHLAEARRLIAERLAASAREPADDDSAAERAGDSADVPPSDDEGPQAS